MEPGSSSVKSSAPAEPPQPRFGGILAILFAGVALSSVGVWQFIRTVNVRRGATTEAIAPGLTLRREVVHTPTEDIPILTVRADTKQGWKLRLEPASPLVSQKNAVSQIASTYNASHQNRAPVAVNGGFFAYQGAAVGAVKVDGEWMRLPWKNRTTIGWDDGAKPFIDNLSARAFVRSAGGEIPVSNLNGPPSASTCALLTWRSGASYTLKTGEVATILRFGKVQSVAKSGEITLPRGVQVLVAGAQAPEKAAVEALGAGGAAAFEVEATPARWNSTANILGAGPRLIQDGAQKTTYVEEEFKPDVLARGPRTLVGVGAQGELIVMVIEAWFRPEGAQKDLRGMTIDAAAAEMQRAGAVQAINLDGGSSTTMWVKGQTVTALSDLVQDKQILQKAAVRREVGVANAVLIERGAPQERAEAPR